MKYKIQTQESEPPLETSGKTFCHVGQCEIRHPTLSAAQIMWHNSMRIPLERLSAKENADLKHTNGMMHVDVKLKLGESHTVEDTQCELRIRTSPACEKVFEFTTCGPVQIPVSDVRPTCISVTCHQGSTELPLKSVFMDLNSKTTKPLEQQSIILAPEYGSSDFLVFNSLSAPFEKLGFKFPCFRYERDAALPAESASEDYDVRQLRIESTQLHANPVIIPSKAVNLVSTKDAFTHLAGLEKNVLQLGDALQACSLHTATVELGASAESAPSVAASVDWTRSYCVANDSGVSEAIHATRSLFRALQDVSNMAVEKALSPRAGAAEAGEQLGGALDSKPADSLAAEAHRTVQELVQTRAELAEAVRGRRQSLESVAQVRAHFIVLQAIDDALRSALRVHTPSKHAEASFVADRVACYDYWLGQIKSNLHNSVTLNDSAYDAARTVLAQCKRLKESGVVVAPASDVRLSGLGCKVWENVLLQGITSSHALVAASAPFMLYKKRTVLDFDRHSMVQALASAECSAEQRESAKLLAILLSHDVEHRIITPALEQSIVRNFEEAVSERTAAGGGKQEEAVNFLLSVYDAPMHSLLATALGRASSPDLSFLTEAALRPPTTGYNTQQVTSFYLQRLSTDDLSL
jgi:hypothetical protein